MPVTKRLKIQLSVNQINSTSQPLTARQLIDSEAINKGEKFTQKKVRTGDGDAETWIKSILELNVSWEKGVVPVHGFCGSEILLHSCFPTLPGTHGAVIQRGSALLSNFLPLPHLQAWNEALSSHLLQDTLSSFLTLRMRPYQYCLCFCDQGSSAILLIGSFLLRVILHGEKKATAGKNNPMCPPS